MNAVHRNSMAGQSTPGVPDASPGMARGCRMLLFLSLLLGSLAAVPPDVVVVLQSTSPFRDAASDRLGRLSDFERYEFR